MKKWLILLILLLFNSLAAGQVQKTALVLTVKDAISPASSDFIHRGLDVAREKQAKLVVIQLDTPGGLDTSMRDIIREVIASSVPVVIYVSPSGARAASAGTYMLYAAHISAMAPATNLGAATPVTLGGLPEIKPPTGSEPLKKDEANKGEPQEEEKESTQNSKPGIAAEGAMTKKAVNDAVAYIRSLAEMRGRNAEWAERAVRESESLSAEQALEMNVIDILARDIPDLLQQIDGRTVMVNNNELVLQTADLVLETLEPDWRNRLLAVITNPNMAYILMLLGIYGLFFELANPGFILPGVIGGICLILALFAMQVLPVNYAGLGLILLGIVFMIGEFFAPSFGALGIGGVIAFVVGSIILFDKDSGNIAISMPLITAVSILSSGLFLITVRAVFNAHRRPVVSGAEELIGEVGEVLEDFETFGNMHLHGETWQIESSAAMQQGDKARVTARDGLILKVEPLQEKLQ